MPRQTKYIDWPDGKDFAFTIIDDTDRTTVENGRPVYQLLADLGMRTTKTVWPVAGVREPDIGGETCADPEYLLWVQGLQKQGFEVAMHNVTYHSSTRQEVQAGLQAFHAAFGAFPRIQVNHGGNRDNLYWGASRLSGLNRSIYKLLMLGRKSPVDGGSSPESVHFWGDICSESIEYVRNFVYAGINTLKWCPYMPYVDERRPFVKQWFAASDGRNYEHFCELLAPKNQETLVRERGLCIVYTHFGKPGFYKNGQLDRHFVDLMTSLSRRNGWFVPVSTVLDEVRNQRGARQITRAELRKLETRWLFEKMVVSRGRG